MQSCVVTSYLKIFFTLSLNDSCPSFCAVFLLCLEDLDHAGDMAGASFSSILSVLGSSGFLIKVLNSDISPCFDYFEK